MQVRAQGRLRLQPRKRQPEAVSPPHLNQVQLGEETHGCGYARGLRVALLGHVVDGHLHVAEQLALQNNKGSGPSQQPPDRPQPTQAREELQGQVRSLGPTQTVLCSQGLKEAYTPSPAKSEAWQTRLRGSSWQGTSIGLP